MPAKRERGEGRVGAARRLSAQHPARYLAGCYTEAGRGISTAWPEQLLSGWQKKFILKGKRQFRKHKEHAAKGKNG